MPPEKLSVNGPCKCTWSHGLPREPACALTVSTRVRDTDGPRGCAGCHVLPAKAARLCCVEKPTPLPSPWRGRASAFTSEVWVCVRTSTYMHRRAVWTNPLPVTDEGSSSSLHTTASSKRLVAVNQSSHEHVPRYGISAPVLFTLLTWSSYFSDLFFPLSPSFSPSLLFFLLKITWVDAYERIRELCVSWTVRTVLRDPSPQHRAGVRIRNPVDPARCLPSPPLSPDLPTPPLSVFGPFCPSSSFPSGCGFTPQLLLNKTPLSTACLGL